MRILQVPIRFYPHVGGVENYVYAISRELTEMGHEIKVVCANELKRNPNETIDGISVRQLPYIGKIAYTNITPGLPCALYNDASNCDLIHTHLPSPWSADWSALVAKARGKPLILTYHNDITADGSAKFIAWIYNATAIKFLLNSVDRIIITQKNYINTSPYIKNYSNKIQIIPCGVNAKKFHPTGIERTPHLLFFLSVLDENHRYKGLDYLIRALAKVKKNFPRIKLIVGGNGNLIEEYKALARSLGIAEIIEFHGFIPDERIVEYYNKCNAFVLPSISSVQEGFGMVLLEAMACATPIISTDIVGVAEDVRRSGAGIIVPPRDEHAMAEALKIILSDNNLALNMGKNGRELVEEKYTWKCVAETICNVYEELI